MNILGKTSLQLLSKSAKCRHLRSISKLYEPPYLEAMKSKVPLYDTLNIQMRGYDFPILESYQKYLHGLVTNMDINVEECWASPAQHMQLSNYKPNSEIVVNQNLLKVYERTIQITDLQSIQLPNLLRVLESTTPAGVTVQVVQHDDWQEEIRYIPDNQLKSLKDELDTLGGPSKKK